MGCAESKDPRLSTSVLEDFMETSSMSREELMKMWEEWKKDHPSGEMSKKSFEVAMGNLLPKIQKDTLGCVESFD